MNTNEMFDKMNAVIGKRNSAELKAQFAKKDKMRADIAKILNGIGKLTTISPVVAHLYDNNLVDTAKHFGQDNEFVSGGMNHRCGFAPSSFLLWGITGGGCSGLSTFVNIVNGKFRVSPWYDESKVPDISAEELVEKYWNERDYMCVCFHLEHMALGIDKFCASVEEFVNNLK